MDEWKKPTMVLWTENKYFDDAQKESYQILCKEKIEINPATTAREKNLNELAFGERRKSLKWEYPNKYGIWTIIERQVKTSGKKSGWDTKKKNEPEKSFRRLNF